MFLSLVSVASLAGAYLLRAHVAAWVPLLALAVLALLPGSYLAWRAERRRAIRWEASASCPTVAVECVSNPTDPPSDALFETYRDTVLELRARDGDCYGVRFDPLRRGEWEITLETPPQLLAGEQPVRLRPVVRRLTEAGHRTHRDLTKIFTQGKVEPSAGVPLVARLNDKHGRGFEARYRVTFDPFQHALSVALVETVPIADESHRPAI